MGQHGAVRRSEGCGGPCVCVYVCVYGPPQCPASVPSLTPHPSPEPAHTKVPGGSHTG